MIASAELQIKSKVAALFDNPLVMGLLKDKVYHVDSDTIITLYGDLNFTLKVDSDRIALMIHDVQPQITAKRGLGMFKVNLKGRITSITLVRDRLLVAIDGLPDVEVPLT